MLLVDGLPRDAEAVGDRLPRPPQPAGVVDMEFLQLLDEVAECRHGSKPDSGLAAVDRIA